MLRADRCLRLEGHARAQCAADHLELACGHHCNACDFEEARLDSIRASQAGTHRGQRCGHSNSASVVKQLPGRHILSLPLKCLLPRFQELYKASSVSLTLGQGLIGMYRYAVEEELNKVARSGNAGSKVWNSLCEQSSAGTACSSAEPGCNLQSKAR